MQGLNVNLQSKTIEEVLGIRKANCLELAEVVDRGITSAASRYPDLSMLQDRSKQASNLKKMVGEMDAEYFNDNIRLTAVRI